MKVGDLVKSIKPYGDPKVGIIIENANIPGDRKNKVFKVLWSTGTFAGIWDHDLEVISETG